MRHLFEQRFTLALLDDVVMSVDAGHRYQFCKLLKEHFSNTQLIITTHDRLWAEQMKSAGLVTGKTSLTFYGWSIEAGPLVETSGGIWQECKEAMGRGRVPEAAAALRRHLEYVSWQLADQLGAPTPFRADGNYELGDLLPPVLKRMNKLFGKAIQAAASWGDRSAKDVTALAKDKLSECAGRSGVEQWAVNKAVHYNAWANFDKSDFEPVVAAFKNLLECFRCDDCGSLPYVSPRTKPDTVRCACNKFSFNLKEKGRE